MSNKQILVNAPEGATHVDINGHYWHNSSAFYWLCCDDGSTCAGDIGNNVRSLADIKEIEQLKAELVTAKAVGVCDALSHVTSCYDWEWECVSATDLQKLMIEYANQLDKE